MAEPCRNPRERHEEGERRLSAWARHTEVDIDPLGISTPLGASWWCGHAVTPNWGSCSRLAWSQDDEIRAWAHWKRVASARELRYKRVEDVLQSRDRGQGIGVTSIRSMRNVRPSTEIGSSNVARARSA